MQIRGSSLTGLFQQYLPENPNTRQNRINASPGLCIAWNQGGLQLRRKHHPTAQHPGLSGSLLLAAPSPASAAPSPALPVHSLQDDRFPPLGAPTPFQPRSQHSGLSPERQPGLASSIPTARLSLSRLPHPPRYSTWHTAPRQRAPAAAPGPFPSG